MNERKKECRKKANLLSWHNVKVDEGQREE